MMLKRLLSVASAFLLSVPVLIAQNAKVTVEETCGENGRVITTHSPRLYRIEEGWCLGAGVGAQSYLGENDKYMRPGDRISFPAVNLEAAKWITPVFGLKLGTEFARMKGLWLRYHPGLDTEEWGNALYREWSDTPYLTVDDPNGKWYYKQSTWTYGVYLVAMADLCNAIGGYKENRIWHTILYAGGGVLGSFGYQFPEKLPEPLKAAGTTYLSPSFNAGWLNRFSLTKNLDLNIDIRGKIVSDKFDGESRGDEPDFAHFKTNFPLDGIMGASLGLAWRFLRRETAKMSY